MKLGVDLFWPAAAATFLALAAVTLHIAAYGRTSRPLGPVLRRFLMLIRLAAVALLVFVLWRPAAESEHTLQRKGRLTLLVDSSRSMSIGDEVVGPNRASVSRLARAASVFAQNASLWSEIVSSYDVECYAFDREVKALPVPPAELAGKALLGADPSGEVTALGEAIARGASGVPPAQAVLVVSDGLSNSGVDPLAAASGLATPVYAVSVGRGEPSESTRDVAVTGVFAPSQAFVNSEISVLGQFNMTGIAGRTVSVSFSADGRQVESREIRAARGEEIAEARFTYKGERTGTVKLEVRADPLADEIVAVNNTAATYVDVKEGALRILYVEGDFRWEAKFIRLALETITDAEVRLVIPRPGDSRELAQALSDPWDVLIIGSASAVLFPAESLPAVFESVSKNGKGLVFLGGPRALGLGGWGSTVLAPLCPFELPAGEIFDPCLWVAEPQTGVIHSEILRLSDGDDFSSWKDFSPLLALNTVGKPREGAVVLLVGKPKKRDETTGALSKCPLRDDSPLLAVQEYGKGRTAAFVAEGTWQWVTGAGIPDEAARERAAAAHSRFWKNLVGWVARREPRGELTLDMETSAHSLALGDSLELRARVMDEKGEPTGPFDIVAEIEHAGGSEKRRFSADERQYRLEWKPPAAGEYRVIVTAERDGAPVARAETAFMVTAVDVEYATLVSKPSVLAALALATSGRYAAADDASYVFSDIMSNATSTRYTALKRRELWSTPWYLAAVLALLAAEWAIRKFVGLV